MDSFEMSDADMVTIGVARLSGDKVYPSTLHEKYMVEKKKPQQLKKHRHFYMILLRGIKYLKIFWDKHHLEFPEGQMYEDIALMIPAFCMQKR